MIKKAIKKGGIWENFGQDELRKLKNKYLPASSLNAKNYDEIKKMLDEYDNWASNFDLSQLKKE